MKIRITPGAVLLLAVTAFDKSGMLLPLLTAVAVHECGHLLAAKCLKIPIRLLELDLPGAKILPALPIPSYGAEGILALAGPLFSLLLALPLWRTAAPFPLSLRATTLSLALFNLLPIEGFDGGRILAACLFPLLGERRGATVLFLSSYLSLLLLFSLSACLLLRYGENAPLAVLSASLFARLFLPFEGRIGNDPKKREFERI